MALAATPQDGQAQVVTDVRLHEGGVLYGQVVTVENIPVADTDVLLTSNSQKLAVYKTDKNGYFAFSSLQSGMYQLVTVNGHQAYRVWSGKIAPPSAQAGALVVVGGETVRGQGRMRNLLANPWVVGAIVATAVAVPVAIHNSKDRS
ncbi:MAG TPA: hypothetical protein VMY42_22855 [Thermoguttaceae bacterium]|nr:hypothetical protein [Thermoguttaceae bacterium]